MIRKSSYFGLIALLFLVIAISGYAIAKSFNLLEGPKLFVLTPKNGETLKNPLIPVEGEAKNIAFLSLNGRQIFVDENGKFSEQILLYEGYNVITVSTEDKFGRTKKEILEVIYLPVEKINRS